MSLAHGLRIMGFLYFKEYHLGDRIGPHVREVGNQLGMAYKTVIPALTLLKKKDWIVETKVGKRKVYRLSESGRGVVCAVYEKSSHSPYDFLPPGINGGSGGSGVDISSIF